jgi:hypothetical protein
MKTYWVIRDSKDDYYLTALEAASGYGLEVVLSEAQRLAVRFDSKSSAYAALDIATVHCADSGFYVEKVTR